MLKIMHSDYCTRGKSENACTASTVLVCHDKDHLAVRRYRLVIKKRFIRRPLLCVVEQLETLVTVCCLRLLLRVSDDRT